MKLGIRKNNKYLRTGGIVIDWEFEDDILDFDKIGQGYSWTVETPIKGNEWAFYYSSNPQRTSNGYKSYDGFQITFSNNVWWQVSAELIGTNKEKTHYRVVFNSIDSVIYNELKTSISKLIDTQVPYFNGGNGTFDQVLAPFNDLGKSGVRFPVIQFYLKPCLRKYDLSFDYPGIPLQIVTQTLTLREANSNIHFAIPFFTWWFLIREIFKKFGYELENNLPGPDMLIHSNKIIYGPVDQNFLDTSALGANLDVKKYLPEITLAQLIYDIQFYAGASAFIDSENKKISFTRIETDLDSFKEVDLSQSLSKQYPEKADLKNIKLSYTLEDDVVKKIPTSGYLGSFDTLNDLAIVANPVLNQYGFVKEYNAYYIFKRVQSTLYPVFLTTPYHSYSSGNDEVKEYSPTLQPHPVKSKHLYQINEFDEEAPLVFTESGNGNYESTFFPGTNSLLAWPDDNGDFAFLQTPIKITAEGAAQVTNVTYIGDVSVTKILAGVYTGKLHPVVIGTGVYNPEDGQNDDNDYTGGILFWHGVKNQEDAGTYPYAASDSYALGGGLLSSYSMDLETPQGLPKTTWKKVILLTRDSYKLVFEGHVSAFKLKELMIRTKIGRYKSGLFRFRRLRAQLSDKGITSQKIEGYRL